MTRLWRRLADWCVPPSALAVDPWTGLIGTESNVQWRVRRVIEDLYTR